MICATGPREPQTQELHAGCLWIHPLFSAAFVPQGYCQGVLLRFLQPWASTTPASILQQFDSKLQEDNGSNSCHYPYADLPGLMNAITCI